VVEVLKQTYSVSLLFFNPNIQPEEEYSKRLQSIETLANLTKTELFVLDEGRNLWDCLIRGLENEPEGGRRCSRCFEIRLKKTAEFAVLQGFKIFTTTLTVSPHKNSRCIQAIGNQEALSSGLRFLSEDFKLHEGYRKSCLLSRAYGLYRQNYCGCRFSIRTVKDHDKEERT